MSQTWTPDYVTLSCWLEHTGLRSYFSLKWECLSYSEVSALFLEEQTGSVERRNDLIPFRRQKLAWYQRGGRKRPACPQGGCVWEREVTLGQWRTGPSAWYASHTPKAQALRCGLGSLCMMEGLELWWETCAPRVTLQLNWKLSLSRVLVCFAFTSDK